MAGKLLDLYKGFKRIHAFDSSANNEAQEFMVENVDDIKKLKRFAVQKLNIHGSLQDRYVAVRNPFINQHPPVVCVYAGGIVCGAGYSYSSLLILLLFFLCLPLSSFLFFLPSFLSFLPLSKGECGLCPNLQLHSRQ